MTKFKSGDKVVPINKTVKGFESLSDSRNWTKAKEANQPFLYIQYFDDVVNAYVCNLDEKTGCGCYFNESDLIPYKKVTKSQRITILENEVAELKLIVHELRERPQLTTVINNSTQGPSTTNAVEDIMEFEGKQYRKVDREAREGDVIVLTEEQADATTYVTAGRPYKVIRKSNGIFFCVNCGDYYSVYSNHYKRTTENVAVYELIESKPLTPNQQRAAIIEKAKKFVEEHSISKTDAKTNKYVCIKSWKTYIEFVVNTEKRTIVALAKGLATHHVVTRGIAKCLLGDVFNEHIGKAIALGRALGLDVSEFEQAVQPTEVVIGMALKACDYKFEEFEYTNVTKIENGKIHGIDSRFGSDSFLLIDAVERYGDWAKHTITNDTNAIYGGVE